MRSRGDTLVEVLFATAIGGLIVMTAIALMNRNLANIQQAIETTIVRQNIDQQAEMLRYITDSFKASRDDQPGVLLKTILEKRIDPSPGATPYGACSPTSENLSKAFYLSFDDTKPSGMDVLAYQDNQSETYARAGAGLWVEAVSPDFQEDQETRYVDFHIRACWASAAGSVNATSGTIVRLFYVTGDSQVVYGGSPSDSTDMTLQATSNSYCRIESNGAECGIKSGAIYSYWGRMTAQYKPTGLVKGKYSMTLTYGDMSEGSKRPPGPDPGPNPYTYKIKIEYDNKSKEIDLDPSHSTHTIDLGEVNNTHSFTIIWLNDALERIDPDLPGDSSNIKWDANFRLDSIRWQKVD